MKLLKPTWVNHNGKPIFGIDIHPDGSRFATGGQGDDSGKIIIWNMAPVKDEEDEKNENIPKVLCEMDNHLACVNCVRWSNNGYYLASGGDDRLVMIWQMVDYGSVPVFGSSKSYVEAWKCAHTLRTHSGDVLDIAWSPHDAWLASCSIDNTIVIWNAVKFPEVITVLRGHSGLIKGVTWDPVGKYLASQADDKSLRVWRTLDWKEEIGIFDPFTECGGTTHVLRLSWSPDGHYIVSAHAMNNCGPTAQIVERDGWKCNMDFVGHRKAVTCVRFNQNIFSKTIKKGSNKNYSCCAIGSRDRSVSIWLTALKRPLVVVHDLFSNSVMDLSWNHSGQSLLACSWDGTICYFEFKAQEIGTALTIDETKRLHEKIYGKTLLSSTNSHEANLTNTIIENPAILKLQQQHKQQQEIQASKIKQFSTPKKEVDSTMAVVEGQTVDVKSKQIETRTPDGRRRITPLYIAPRASLSGPPRPFNGAAQNLFGQHSTNEQEGKVTVKKEKDEAVDVSMKTSGSIPANIQPMSALDSRFTEKSSRVTSTPVSDAELPNTPNQFESIKETPKKKKVPTATLR